MPEPFGISAAITPGGAIDPRLPAAIPVDPGGQRSPGSSGDGEQAKPSTEFNLGTTVEAIVRAAAPDGTAGAFAVGTRLLLRVVALPDTAVPSLLVGRVISSGGAETLIATSLGLLALLRRLALAPDTVIAFECLEETPPSLGTEEALSRVGGWPALEQAIAVLAQASPPLAAKIRSALLSSTAAELAGSLLFLLGTIYENAWPSADIIAALSAAGQAKLAQRLGADAAELRRLQEDLATGTWRVLTIPLLAGSQVTPLRLYLPRRSAGSQPDEVHRFACEIELPGLGPLQLDGLYRGARLVLVIRSHRGLPPKLREAIAAAYRHALDIWGLSGDLSFAIVAKFALAPLLNLRKHVEVSV